MKQVMRKEVILFLALATDCTSLSWFCGQARSQCGSRQFRSLDEPAGVACGVLFPGRRERLGKFVNLILHCVSGEIEACAPSMVNPRLRRTMHPGDVK